MEQAHCSTGIQRKHGGRQAWLVGNTWSLCQWLCRNKELKSLQMQLSWTPVVDPCNESMQMNPLYHVEYNSVQLIAAAPCSVTCTFRTSGGQFGTLLTLQGRYQMDSIAIPQLHDMLVEHLSTFSLHLCELRPWTVCVDPGVPTVF